MIQQQQQQTSQWVLTSVQLNLFVVVIAAQVRLVDCCFQGGVDGLAHTHTLPLSLSLLFSQFPD